MHREQQAVLRRIEAEQRGPQQRSAGQVEGAARLGGAEGGGGGLPAARGQGVQILHRQEDLRRRLHLLDRAAVAGRKAGA